MDAHQLVKLKPNPKIPEFRPGDTVRVGYRIREGARERVQAFQGVVIRKSGGRSPAAAFTVRAMFRGIGVERIFPLYSPRIDSMEVLRAGKVRQARLYYLRKRFGRAARIRERTVRPRPVDLEVIEEEPPKALENLDLQEKPALPQDALLDDGFAATDVETDETAVVEEEASTVKPVGTLSVNTLEDDPAVMAETAAQEIDQAPSDETPEVPSDEAATETLSDEVKLVATEEKKDTGSP